MLEFKQIYGHKGYAAARPLREEVFINEQGFSYDYDEHDDEAWHIVGYERGELIAAARMYAMDKGVYKIGRVAVKKELRRGYIGDLMMKTLQDKAVGLGGIETVVFSRTDARGFYEFEGYEQSGAEFEEGGFPHVMMRKDLTRPSRSCCCNHNQEGV